MQDVLSRAFSKASKRRRKKKKRKTETKAAKEEKHALRFVVGGVVWCLVLFGISLSGKAGEGLCFVSIFVALDWKAVDWPQRKCSLFDISHHVISAY